MTPRFELEKEVEKVRFVLKKSGIHVVEAEVGLDLDVSGSMKGLYQNGTVQRVVERVLAVGLACDPDKKIDIWGFATGTAYVCAGTVENYVTIVDHEMMDGDLDAILWGGTQYAPVIQANLDHYRILRSQRPGFLSRLFSSGQSADDRKFPTIMYFVTDGANSDPAAAEALFEKIREAGGQIYYVLVCVGKDAYNFLRRVASELPNVGFVRVTNLQQFVSDDSVYEQLIPHELCQWLHHHHDDDDDDDDHHDH